MNAEILNYLKSCIKISNQLTEDDVIRSSFILKDGKEVRCGISQAGIGIYCNYNNVYLWPEEENNMIDCSQFLEEEYIKNNLDLTELEKNSLENLRKFFEIQ